MGHLIKCVLLRVGNLTMIKQFECAEYERGTKFVLQLVSEYQVCLFTMFS